MPTFSQSTRQVEFYAQGRDDLLAFQRLSGTEGISELFRYDVQVVAEIENFDFDELIGSNCSVKAKIKAHQERYFDGLLTESTWIGKDSRYYIYQLTLRPWLWLATNRTDNRIFHEKTAPDIIKEVLGFYGYKYVTRLSKSYSAQEYTVQYRETDFNFVSRLMEMHGISYFFTHENGSHEMVLTDGPSGFDKAPENAYFYRQSDADNNDQEHIFSFLENRSLTPGKTTLIDYDFKASTAKMEVETAENANHQHNDLEKYDYPGKYIDRSDGDDLAKVRMDMERSKDQIYTAEGDSLTLSPGMMMTLADHPTNTYNREYLTLQCTHTLTTQGYISGHDGEGGSYSGNYEFALADKPFIAPFVARRPFVQGPQTATVVGDGEIDCDRFGRITVKFHWDRMSDISMRCRVAQVWAGDKWGGIFIPRVGMEVIVEFLEGDPDRPIVIGCVYNDKHMPPYDLPGEKNLNGWKSNSTEGGGGYNEFVFDDTKGDELVRTHAERDMETKVLNDERRNVSQNRKSEIDANDTLLVGKELFIDAKTKITLKCGGSTIVMDPSSIEIKSTNIEIKAGAQYKSSAGMTSEHKAGALMDIKGALVKINS